MYLQITSCRLVGLTESPEVLIAPRRERETEGTHLNDTQGYVNEILQQNITRITPGL